MALNYEKLIEKVNNIPLSEVVSLRVNLIKKGHHYFGVCPFHDDHTLGSFSVNDEKHIAKCFSCNNGAVDAIHFICQTDKVSRKEALLRISLGLGFITDNEYSKSTGQSFDWKNTDYDKLISNLKINNTEKNIADLDSRNLVYKTLSSLGNKLDNGNDVLTEEHRKYLHGRGILDDEIKKYGYFTMPSRRAVVKLVKKLSAFGLESNILAYVPGFYYNSEKKFFTLKPLKGIGIPIRDIKGQIQGIQVRRDGEIGPGDQRYFWWSTTSEEMGASPGCPLDILIPDEIKTNACFITEGHFKAAEIIKKYEVPAISVQGINNWKPVSKTLEAMKTTLKSVWIAYDADMAVNVNVIDQALKLAEDINKKNPELKIYFVVWDFTKGKGIDDILKTTEKLKKWDYSTFKQKCELFNSFKKNNEEEKISEFRKLFLNN